MKCPKCGYEQAIYDDINEWWHCPQCHGSGEASEVEMTNEEWLRSATTEELAGKIYAWHTKGYARGKNGLPLNPITEVVEWLKQPKE